MKTIKFDFCSNLGGIHRIYAIPPESVEDIVYQRSSGTARLYLSDTEEIIDIYCTEDTLNFSEEQSQPASGPTYNPVITGITPKANPVNQEQLVRLESSYWLVLFEDNNGMVRLAGDQENHLVFTRNETTGQTYTNRNQVSFSFSGSQSHPAYFIDPEASVFL